MNPEELFEDAVMHFRISYFIAMQFCLLVWRDRVGCLTTDPEVMRSGPATDIAG